MTLMDDSPLIEGMARGDRTAFREFVERYKKKVYFLALDMVGNPADAEDVSQEVFLKVFRSFATFKKDAKLSSWLYRVTYNASIDHLRRKETVPEPVGDGFLESRSWPRRSSPPSTCRSISRRPRSVGWAERRTGRAWRSLRPSTAGTEAPSPGKDLSRPRAVMERRGSSSPSSEASSPAKGRTTCARTRPTGSASRTILKDFAFL
jgi:RNA polymerase sigma factor (sigma-70 family)